MEKGYYEIIIKVLTLLIGNEKPMTPKIKRIAGEHWGSVREYLDENGIVMFAGSDSVFEVRKNKAHKHLDMAKIELAKIEKAEADRRLDRISKRTSIIISIAAFAVSLISLYFSLTK